MLRIGMLGGMSWESTAQYYRLANELVRDRLGGLHSARILLDSVDFADIEAMQSEARWDDAGRALAARAAALELAGADLLLICTNTMHKVYDAVDAAVTIPVLHLADATAAAVKRAGVSTVALLGTAFTMEQPFYRERVAAAGVEVLVPEAGDRAVVHTVIYEELVRGIVRDDSREALRGIISSLAAAGAQGVILGCTELELLVGPDDVDVAVFPTTRIHVEEALAAAGVPG